MKFGEILQQHNTEITNDVIDFEGKEETAAAIIQY